MQKQRGAKGLARCVQLWNDGAVALPREAAATAGRGWTMRNGIGCGTGMLRCAVLGAALVAGAMTPGAAPAQMGAANSAPALGKGVLPAAQVEKLLPPSVYYSGQSAPLQVRNAAAIRSAGGAIAWFGLVDTSGYSTGVREKYQFYMVTEAPLKFGDATLPAGAYGAGFLADGSAVVMDLGGHEVKRTALKTDAELRRPRPLQVVETGAGYKLYLGRQFVLVALP